jgi:hypothetical protein
VSAPLVGRSPDSPRLLRDQGRSFDAKMLLKPVYDRFTEGFDRQGRSESAKGAARHSAIARIRARVIATAPAQATRP